MTTPTTWFGDRAVSVPLDGGRDREQVVRRLEAVFPRLLVRRGIASVLVESDEPDPGLLAAVDEALRAITDVPAAAVAPTTNAVLIEVRYDGPDLEDVAADLGCSPDVLVLAHQEQTWRVAMMGFAPGFGYLLPDGPPVLPWSAVERRARPRERVHPGAVAVAAGMSAVYPEAMPGGWPLIGRTSVRLFDPDRSDDPALLAPGDLVVFCAVDA